MDTTLKIEELSSPEEIAVGIAGERSTKSRTLSHYEDRRERKGWLVKGVHGISIARRNNWVQSGRLPYVTSAPFKRESASASSSHSHPRPHPSHSPHSRTAPDLPPSRQKDQLDMGKKRAEEGDYRVKCTETREGRVRERERKDRKRRRQKETKRSRPRKDEGDMNLKEKRSTRTLWKQGQEIRGAVAIKARCQ